MADELCCGSSEHEPTDNPVAAKASGRSSYTIARSVAAILSQATALHPSRSTASDGTIGDPAHAARVSDHNPDSRGIVHAADLTHDPAHGMDAHAWADQLRLKCKSGAERRVKYIISNRRIASETANWAWRSYSGSNAHTQHVHISINSGTTYENDVSPWFTAKGLTVAEIQELIEVIQRQGDLTREAIRNTAKDTQDVVKAQGKLTRDKIAATH